MDEARARRLQPYYIELAFKEVFTRFGGRMARREKGRYEVSSVPAVLGKGKYGPIASRYDRVAFDLGTMQPDGLARADLLAPGHPLHDSVMELAVTTLAGVLNRGTVLVSGTIEAPRLLVGVIEEVVDSTGASVARRFGYAYADEDGSVVDAGPAPYLDCVAAPDTDETRQAKALPWLHDAESRAVSWIIGNQLPHYLAEIQPRRTDELDKQRQLVKARLRHERERILHDAKAAFDKERIGEKPKESSASLAGKAADLQVRLDRRLELIDQQSAMATKPPLVVAAALILPVAMLSVDLPAGTLVRARETKAVERRGVDLVLARERVLGRAPEDQALNKPGYDIVSTDPSTGETYRIKVKARLVGAQDFWVTHNEVITGKNAAPRYRLALVQVDPRGAVFDDVRYLDDPFTNVEMTDFEATGHKGDWTKNWTQGKRRSEHSVSWTKTPDGMIHVDGGASRRVAKGVPDPGPPLTASPPTNSAQEPAALALPSIRFH